MQSSGRNTSCSFSLSLGQTSNLKSNLNFPFYFKDDFDDYGPDAVYAEHTVPMRM